MTSIYVMKTVNKLPRATAQQKGARRTKNGIRFYEKAEVRDARKFYRDIVLEAISKTDDLELPLKGPIGIDINITYSSQNVKGYTQVDFTDEEYYWKSTRPDLDNTMKLILDAITDAGVWEDDAQLVSIFSNKYIQKQKEESEETIYIHIHTKE